MTKDARKMSKLKLIMGITIPVFVMIASLIMVGVSFAWFSDSAEVDIATINLATTRVFTLEFSNIGAIDSTNIYTGEYALNRDGYLVSNYRRLSAQKTDETYLDDAPFMFGTTIAIATDELYVDFNIRFTFAQIEYQEGSVVDGEFVPAEGVDPYDMDIYGAESDNDPTIHPYHYYNSDKIPYAFTWFLIEHGQTLETADVIYTPYGTIVLDTASFIDPDTEESLGTYSVADTLNGKDITSINGTSAEIDDGTINSIQDVSQFRALKDGDDLQLYDFYIVFAPEKLFWMQFFEDDMGVPFTTVYTAQELTQYISRGQTVSDCNKMYYAEPTYIGATFNFIAEINVTQVYWDGID